MYKAWSVSVIIAALVCSSILLLEGQLQHIVLLPDQGASWYYWKRSDPSFSTQASAWGGYLAHQFFIWGVIAWAQRNRSKLKDRSKMHPINWIALGGTAIFALLHYLQTALWYDGLAQDVSVFSSQASVALLLVVVLVIEAPRRGLFFGQGKKMFVGVRPFLIRYHGYYFSWAVVYTYWFHPMETTLGHLLGFFYTFLLMIQAGFIFTRVHTNKFWTAILEVLVVFHGVLVAIIAGQEVWPMFMFGFLMMFIVTQMHGIGLSKVFRWIIALIFVASIFVVYSSRGWQYINEVIRIPMIEYLLAFFIVLIVLLIFRFTKTEQSN